MAFQVVKTRDGIGVNIVLAYTGPKAQEKAIAAAISLNARETDRLTFFLVRGVEDKPED